MDDQLSNPPNTLKHAAQIERLLHGIHRIRVLLWVRDYKSAEREMRELERDHRKLLADSEQAEKIFRKEITDIPKGWIEEDIKEKYGNFPLTKYQMEYLIDIETTRHAVRHPSEEFDADDFAVSPITKTVQQLQRQIDQAEKLSRPTVPDIERDRDAAKYFISFEQLDSTRVNYRILRLDISHPLTGALIVERLAEVFDATPTSTDRDSQDYVLPLQVRFFITDALVEITIYDQERLAVEITSSHLVQPHDVFKKVYDVIGGTLA